MDEVARRFRRGAQARAGLRYPAELKQLATQYSELARARGDGWQEIAETLGVCAPTLVRWCEGAARTTEQKSLHEVVVVETGASRGPGLVMPSGARVAGLSVRNW